MRSKVMVFCLAGHQKKTQQQVATTIWRLATLGQIAYHFLLALRQSDTGCVVSRGTLTFWFFKYFELIPEYIIIYKNGFVYELARDMDMEMCGMSKNCWPKINFCTYLLIPIQLRLGNSLSIVTLKKKQSVFRQFRGKKTFPQDQDLGGSSQSTYNTCRACCCAPTWLFLSNTQSEFATCHTNAAAH